jgi:hypothetical protein
MESRFKYEIANASARPELPQNIYLRELKVVHLRPGELKWCRIFFYCPPSVVPLGSVFFVLQDRLRFFYVPVVYEISG